MTGLDDLYGLLPTDAIADKLHVDRAAVESAYPILIPAVLEVVHKASEDPERAEAIDSAAGLLDTGEGLDTGESTGGSGGVIATIFGSNADEFVSTLVAKSGGGNGDLFKQLLPLVTPILLSILGQQQPKGAAATGGGDMRGKILGSILSSFLNKK